VHYIEFDRYLSLIADEAGKTRVSMIALSSINGSISHAGSSERLSCEEDRVLLHTIRLSYDISVFGMKTVLLEPATIYANKNPSLVLINRRRRESFKELNKILKRSKKTVTILCENSGVEELKKSIAWSENLRFLSVTNFDPGEILSLLRSLFVKRILIEGGATTYQFFSEYIESVQLSISPMITSDLKYYHFSQVERFKLRLLTSKNNLIYSYYSK
jgi:riboflavin biosynthesis pyrimidine reductase